ncbi:hypothetical protein A4U49_02945 [Acidithiobacillus ferrivorans]|nr:hypothetical protein A4U49_02945 [Acidithiobacillus ferrivorans]
MKAMQISRDTSVISKGKKILVATHSWAMAERIDGILDALNGGTPPEGITTFPLLSLLQLHAGHIGQKRMDVIGEDSSEGRSKSVDIIRRILSTHNVIDENGMSPWLANGLRASEDSRSRLELIVNLYDEISGVLTASGVSSDDADSISEYFSNSREDWMPPFVTQADKEFVISIYRGFTQELIDMSCITTDQFVLDSIRILETFTWRMRKETEGYDYIMVDELQLFDPQERSALELLGRSRKGVPFITSEDPSQGIFSALNTRPKSVQNEPIYLDTVHRFNKEIFDLVYFIYRKFPLNNISLKIAQNQAAQEDRPRLYMRRSEDDAIALACKLVAEKNTSSINSDNICVVTLGDVDNKITDCLESLKLPTIRMTSFDDVEQLAYSKRSIVVAPWQYVGGCQFTHVFVVTATLETPESQFAKLKELTSVYLSCSRAIESLTFISSGYTPSVIKDAMGHGLIIQQQ